MMRRRSHHPFQFWSTIQHGGFFELDSSSDDVNTMVRGGEHSAA